jgi:ketosteroid isomerase-like protein
LADSTAQIREVEERRWAAIIASDIATLDAFYSPDLAYTHSNGMFDSKASYLKPIRDGAVKYTAVRRSNEEIRVHGDTAVVTGRADMDVIAGGNSLNPVMRYSAIWARTADQWQLVCWHACAVVD